MGIHDSESESCSRGLAINFFDMPASNEISAVSSGLYFTSKNEVTASVVKLETKGSGISTAKEGISHSEAKSMQANADEDQGIVDGAFRVWLYPAPIHGGEVTESQRRRIENSATILVVWDSLMLFALLWVSWSVRV